MLILKKDFKGGVVCLQPETTDDLWYLSQLIEPGDSVKSRTLRKIRLEGAEDRKPQATRRPVTLEIKCEKVSLEGDSLRVLGTVTLGPEDVSRGSYHSFSVEPNTKLWITKSDWPNYQRKQLEHAAASKKTSILAVLIERDEATFARITGAKFIILSTMHGEVPKKGEDARSSNTFFRDAASKLSELVLRERPERVIVASSSFWKEDFLKDVKDESVSKLIVQATCSDAGEQGIRELLRRPELAAVLADVRVAEEAKIVEALFREISSKGKAAYGQKDVALAAEAGAVEKLLVTDGLIKKARETGGYEGISAIMRGSESTKAEVKILSSVNEPGKKLDSLGGIAAILRFRISS